MGDLTDTGGRRGERSVGEFVSSYYERFRDVLDPFDPSPIGDIVRTLSRVRDLRRKSNRTASAETMDSRTDSADVGLRREVEIQR